MSDTVMAINPRSDSVNVLIQALDAAPSPVPFFLRDDDAGWDDPGLLALLDCTQRAGVPVDLAAIPQATGAALATSLCWRMNISAGLIGVHQHGLAHCNHETMERKCEFGGARSADAQRHDLRAGRDRLQALFGSRLDTFFTPPWNRCSAGTPQWLAELGFSALSRSRGAPAQHALPELAVDVDWCKQRRLAAADAGDGLRRIALELARCCVGGRPVGLMLHHAEMDATDLSLLAALFGAVKHHPNARWQLMRDLLPRTAAPSPLD